VALLASIHRYYLFITIFPIALIVLLVWKDVSVITILGGIIFILGAIFYA